MTLRVLFFVQHFYPSPEIGAKRPTELARRFLARGNHVDVITAGSASPARDPDGDLSALRIFSVPIPSDLTSEAWARIKRVSWRRRSNKPPAAQAINGAGVSAAHIEQPRQRGLFIRWFLSFEGLFSGLKSWTIACAPTVWSALRNNCYDLVVTSCPPVNTALLIRIMRSLRAGNFHWVLDLRDPFATTAAPAYSSKARSLLEEWAERSCFQDCDAIVVASPGMQADIVRRFPGLQAKVHVVYNGFDGVPMVPPDVPAGLPLRLLSAGTIYLNRDPSALLDALTLAISNGRLPRNAFHVTFLGKCESPSREVLQEWVNARGLADTVSVAGTVAPTEVERYLLQAHVLVNFAQNQHLMIPAKTYEYMASGRETLTITEADSETARIVRRALCGPVAPPDPTTLSRILVDLYVRYIERRQRYVPNAEAVQEFSRDNQCARFLSICDGLTS
jgi:glycosyltransferase involved in cell wall biosynthesis